MHLIYSIFFKMCQLTREINDVYSLKFIEQKGSWPERAEHAQFRVDPFIVCGEEIKKKNKILSQNTQYTSKVSTSFCHLFYDFLLRFMELRSRTRYGPKG